MGAYLSEPLTTKSSSDECNDCLASGSSSMQGWRISQEDAHNCILDFDKKTSFFAVYDGHGGAEVAAYCSLYLPQFLRKLQTYKSEEFETALKEAFIGFDATLLEERVIDELRKISEKTVNGDEEAMEDEDEDYDNVDDLCKEATMPLNEVLEQYKDHKTNPAIKSIKEGGSSKPVSPFLKGKRRGGSSNDTNEAGSSSSSSSCNAASSSSSSSSSSSAAPSSSCASESGPNSSKKRSIVDNEDAIVSSSSNNSNSKNDDDDKANQEPTSSISATIENNVNQINEITDTEGNSSAKGTSSSKESAVPDSSSCTNSVDADTKPNEQPEPATAESSVVESVTPETTATSNATNGDVSGSDSPVKKETVSSSSSAAAQENGEVTSNSNVADSKPIASAVDSSSEKPKNGPKSIDENSSDDDSTDEDEAFPDTFHGDGESSSTEEGEEDIEDDSDEEEDDDDEGDEEEDYLNAEDEEFMNNIADEPGKDSGCTAVVALLHDKDLYVANAGDSRCVVCRNGTALEMSFDHKPEDQIEFDRIKKAGGRVTLDGRVNGGLNLSRAIGDHGYKMNKKLPPEEQMISALPDIKKITLTPEDEFMVLACDGIWNFMTSEDVVNFVQKRIKKGDKKMSQICEEMFENCLAPHTKGDGTGCDNMTAIIVQFKPNFVCAESASRKRAASPTPAATDDEQLKKLKTEEPVDASSST